MFDVSNNDSPRPTEINTATNPGKNFNNVELPLMRQSKGTQSNLRVSTVIINLNFRHCDWNHVGVLARGHIHFGLYLRKVSLKRQGGEPKRS